MPSTRRSLAQFALLGMAGAAFWLAACAGTPTLPPGLIEREPAAVVTETELEARVQDLAYRFNVEATALAYDIFAESKVAMVRQTALIMAIRVGQELTRAQFYGDPVASVVELWRLTSRLVDYFESGDASTAFGEHQELVVSVFKGMRSDVLTLAKMLDSDAPERLESRIGTWVNEHPITGTNLARESTSPLFAALDSLNKNEGRTIWQASETLEEGMSEISDRLETLQTEIPLRFTMSAALIVEEKLEDLDFDARMKRIEEALVLTGTIPETITEERTMVIETLQEERATILEAVSKERDDIVAELEVMRSSSFDRIESMRQETVGSVQVAADDAFARIDEQRQDTLDQISVMVDRMLEVAQAETDETVEQVNVIATRVVGENIDRLFWMLVKLGGGLFVGAALLLVLARVLWRSAR